MTFYATSIIGSFFGGLFGVVVHIKHGDHISFVWLLVGVSIGLGCHFGIWRFVTLIERLADLNPLKKLSARQNILAWFCIAAEATPPLFSFSLAWLVARTLL